MYKLQRGLEARATFFSLLFLRQGLFVFELTAAAGTFPVIAEIIKEMVQRLLPVRGADEGSRALGSPKEPVFHQTCDAVVAKARMTSVQQMQKLLHTLLSTVLRVCQQRGNHNINDEDPATFLSDQTLWRKEFDAVKLVMVRPINVKRLVEKLKPITKNGTHILR